jgi:uncharacterized protein (DUF362 family)
MAAVLALLAPAFLLLAVPASPVAAADVGIARIAYDGPKDWTSEHEFFLALTDDQVRQAVAEAIRNALGPGGLAAIISPGNRVTIKPNIVQARERMGDVTDIRVLRAVCTLAREAAGPEAKLTVVESTLSTGLGAYREAGYDENGDALLDGIENVPLVDLDAMGTDKCTRINLSPQLFWGELWLPDILRTKEQALAGPAGREDIYSDVTIAVPVFKNHSNASVTCALKSRVGCAPNAIYVDRSAGTKSIHKDASGRDCLNQAIVDLNRIRPDNLAVLDCLTGHIHGPSLFKVPTLQDLQKYIIFPFFVVAGKDLVAVDVVAASLMGYDPKAVTYVELAAANGLGTNQAKDIIVAGPSVAECRAALSDRYGSRGKYPFPAGYGNVNPSRRTPDTAAPVSAEVLGPPGGLVVPGGKSRIRVRSSDNAGGKGILRLELFAGAERLGRMQMDPSATAETQFDWAPAAPGAYSLEALASDDCFNETWSAPLEIQAVLSPFQRGDANSDGDIDIADPIRILVHLFVGSAPLPCIAAADADDGGTVDVSDAIGILMHLFVGPASIAPPFPLCGLDPTPDLVCEASPCIGR